MAKPAASLARSSSLCRSRRSIVPSSPQSQRAQLPPHAPHPSHPRHPHHPQHTQHSLPSPDPDILSVSSCPALYRNEEEEEAIYFSAEKQWYWQWMNCIQSGLGWAGLAGWVGDVCCVNFFLLRHKLPQSWWLQTTPVYGLSVLYAKAQARVARLSSHKIGVLAGLCSYLEPGGKAQLWRQNSVPCGCSAEVLASVLVLSWGLPSVSRGYSLPGVATIFKALKRQEKEGQRRKEREWERKGIHSNFFL